VGIARGSAAKVQSQFAMKRVDKIAPLMMVTCHPNRSWAAVAYSNGVIRIFDFAERELRQEMDTLNAAGESVTAIAFHPEHALLVGSTSIGRLLVWRIVAGSEAKERKIPFPPQFKELEKVPLEALVFTESNPSLLIALAHNNRIMFKKFAPDGQPIASSLFPKISKPLLQMGRQLTLEVSTEQAQTANSPSMVEPRELQVEPGLGMMAMHFDSKLTSAVYLFEPTVISHLFRSQETIPCPIDTPLSTEKLNAVGGSVVVNPNVLFISQSRLYEYHVQDKRASELCRVSPGSVYRLHSARDESSAAVAAMVFLGVESNIEGTEMDIDYQDDGESRFKYVICIKKGEKEGWNSSEPQDGRDGCFLGEPGKHSRLLVISATGKAFAALNFKMTASKGTTSNEQIGGVYRSKFTEPCRASRVFASPMNNGNAVVYWDEWENRLVVSKNWRFGGDVNNLDFDLDTVVKLKAGEAVYDLRWQEVPTGTAKRQFFASALTSQRVLFFKNRMEPLAAFRFDFLERCSVPCMQPTMVWNGPVVSVMVGSQLYSISIDGQHDLLASCGNAENMAKLITVLPDTVVYLCKPPADRPFSIGSRSIASVQPYINGVLGIPTSSPNHHGGEANPHIEKVKSLLARFDSNYISSTLIEKLMESGLSSIAHTLVLSQQGLVSIPALQRARFLVALKDLRRSLQVLEGEYSLLPNASYFHPECELYRLFQTLFNHAVALRDFNVAKRCSSVLGRNGTLMAFVDREGGMEALQSLLKMSEQFQNDLVKQALIRIHGRAKNSSVAISHLVIDTRSKYEPNAPIMKLDLADDTLCDVYVKTDNDAQGNRALLKKEGSKSIAAMLERNYIQGQSGADSVGEREFFVFAAGEEANNMVQDNDNDEEGFVEPNSMSRGLSVPGGIGGAGTPDIEIQKCRQCLTDAIISIDSGDLNNALVLVAQGIKTYASLNTLQNKEILVSLVWHNLAIRLMSRVVELLKPADPATESNAASQPRATQAVQTSQPRTQEQRRCMATWYATILTEIPIASREIWLRSVKAAIQFNISLGNYGVAGRGIQLLRSRDPSFMEDAVMSKNLMLCQSRKFMNAHPQPSSLICFKSLVFLKMGMPVASCNVCPAKFAPSAITAGVAAAAPPNNRYLCPGCSLGSLH